MSLEPLFSCCIYHTRTDMYPHRWHLQKSLAYFSLEEESRQLARVGHHVVILTIT